MLMKKKNSNFPMVLENSQTTLGNEELNFKTPKNVYTKIYYRYVEKMSLRCSMFYG